MRRDGSELRFFASFSSSGYDTTFVRRSVLSYEGSLLVRKHHTFESTFVLSSSPTFVVSYFRTKVLSYFRTFVLSYFRTFVLSYFRTKVLSYEDRIVEQ